MADLFLKILNMSIAAGYLVLAVVLLRPLLKKAPRWTMVLLWGIVALRLLFPFSIESALSLIPSAETIPESVLSGPSFDVQTGIPPVDNTVNDYLGDHYFEGVTRPAGNGLNFVSTLTVIWLAGMVAMAAYTAISYWRLRRRIATAIRERDNIFRSENVASPFVLGVVRPKIYLPHNMAQQDAAHVIAHERSHIRRKDHWWKPLGFALLTVHWFNPLMWLAYILLCRDIELACDEKVIKELGTDQRADYSEALLKCSVKRRMIAACPLAFGEVGVKERVKNVLSYKKPAFWIIIVAVIACIVVAVCFLTDPVKDPQETSGGETDPAVIIWYEYDNPEYNQTTTWQLDVFPGVTFRLTNGVMEAEVNGEATELCSGTVHVYVSDINGDCYPEICANCTTYTSGIYIPDSVFVFDYANQAGYRLGYFPDSSFSYWDLHSYSLRVEDGQLLCDKTESIYSNTEFLVTGQLAIVETAEGGMLYLKPFLTEEYPMAYIFDGENPMESSTLTVYADGTCQFMSSPVSSYLGLGTYKIANGKLTMQTNDGVYTLVFLIVDAGLQFLAEESSESLGGSGLYDGAILIKTSILQDNA